MGGASGMTCAIGLVRPLAFSGEETAKLIGASVKTLAN